MIDTIRLEIHELPKQDVAKVREKLESHLVVDNKSGLVQSEITRGSLKGSWDSRISVQIRDYEYKTLETVNMKRVGRFKIIDAVNSSKKPVRVSAPEFLVVEFSLPKWFEGVNFINSSLDEDLRRLTLFKEWFDLQIGIQTPIISSWILKRLDIAYCFDLYSYNNILRYVESFRNLDYTRRKKPQFYQDSLFCAGSTTTLKAYSKEMEFKKHDYKRLYIHTMSKEFVDLVHDLTKGLFRFEVEFKKRKIESFGVLNVGQIANIDWEAEMQKELYKLIKGGKSGRVFKYSEVLEELYAVDIKGSDISRESCAAIWASIVMKGDKYAKSIYGARKVQRALKIFERLGITVQGLLEERKVSPILTEVNLMQYQKQDGDSLRKKYNALIKKAA